MLKIFNACLYCGVTSVIHCILTSCCTCTPVDELDQHNDAVICELGRVREALPTEEQECMSLPMGRVIDVHRHDIFLTVGCQQSSDINSLSAGDDLANYI